LKNLCYDARSERHQITIIFVIDVEVKRGNDIKIIQYPT